MVQVVVKNRHKMFRAWVFDALMVLIPISILVVFAVFVVAPLYRPETADQPPRQNWQFWPAPQPAQDKPDGANPLLPPDQNGGGESKTDILLWKVLPGLLVGAVLLVLGSLLYKRFRRPTFTEEGLDQLAALGEKIDGTFEAHRKATEATMVAKDDGGDFTPKWEMRQRWLEAVEKDVSGLQSELDGLIARRPRSRAAQKMIGALERDLASRRKELDTLTGLLQKTRDKLANGGRFESLAAAQTELAATDLFFLELIIRPRK